MHFDYNRHKNLVLNLVDHETSKSIIKKGFSWLNTPIQSHQREPPNEKLHSYLSKIQKIKNNFLHSIMCSIISKNLTTFTRSNKGLFSAVYVGCEACFSYFVIMRKCCTISVTLLYICINVLLQHIFCNKWIMLTDMHEQTKTKPLIA